MDETRIVVPDLGETSEVEVVEILVSPGDRVGLDDPVIVLESDKASMDLPSPAEGVVTSVEVSIGDRVAAGTLLVGLDTGSGAEVSGAGDDEAAADEAGGEPTDPAAATGPDAGGAASTRPLLPPHGGTADPRPRAATGSRASNRGRRSRRRHPG